jgi:hypothetical protein
MLCLTATKQEKLGALFGLECKYIFVFDNWLTEEELEK